MTTTPTELLRQYIWSIHPLQEDAWNDFASIWQPVNAARKTILTAAGDTEKYLYFVLNGVQRAFYQKENGKEATLVFTYPGSFSGVADSFLLQKPSLYFLETLTRSSFLRTDFSRVEAMLKKHTSLREFITRALALTLSGTLQRQIELQCFNATEKFSALMSRSPHVLNLIPHKYLASYLGIDAATFSKLLGTVRIGT